MCCRKLVTSQINKINKKKANAIRKKKKGQTNPTGMIHWNDFSGIYIYELWGFCGFFSFEMVVNQSDYLSFSF